MLRLLYTLIFYLALPLVWLRLWVKGRRNAAYRARILERLGYAPFSCERSIWIHAVSLGESVAAIPLIEELLRHYPDYSIVVTTTTPTGSSKIIQHFGTRVFHCYFPYDLPTCWLRFFKRINPKLLLIMEVELWPNLLRYAKRHAVPVMLLNARMSDNSFRRYQYLKPWVKGMLSDINLVAAQSEMDAQRFLTLGAMKAHVVVAGNLKFDVKVDAVLKEKAVDLRKHLMHQPIWIAASTHKGEEEQILKIHQNLLQAYPHALLILVPRHPERFQEVKTLCETFKMKTLMKSSGDIPDLGVQVFLGDTMGELQFYYGLADVAFVGGTLVNVGGHNPLEPLALGKRVVVGPYIHNARSLYQDLQVAGLVKIEKDASSVEQALVQTLSEPVDCRTIERYIEKFRGVKGRIVGLIDSLNLER